MAQFKAVIQGAKGETSRLGNKTSGISASIDGWDLGIDIECGHTNGRDEFYIYKTGGSNSSRRTLLCSVNTAEAKVVEMLGVHVP